ncbi:sugar phosphate isomerase/epimerase [uncultured Tateyamaria sp.]|uniref:sugar phosphate isomerase/epimerase family protein n=1 Tax=uncultured Tateyamaria sp. TaxID=455651 RepID=UPI00260ED920|nr:sugar phosphate isomerase/epimerase [uncultured Tateyamaria sp.]
MTAFSYQLYSSRMFPPLGDTLQMLADLGYAEVEGYGALLDDPAMITALADGLKTTGLTMPTCHVALEMCQKDPAKVVDIAAQLGVKTAVIPYIHIDDRPTDAAGWRAYGAGLEEVQKRLAEDGIALAYHNHDFECVAMADGTMPIDLILEAAPSVYLEYDPAWAVRAGADPAETITKHGGRILCAHLKDIAPEGEAEDEDGWADVGHGTMDWPGLFGALKSAGTRHFIMEHDKPSDHHRFARRALAAAKTF